MILAIIMFINASLVCYTIIKSAKENDKYVGNNLNTFLEYYRQNENVQIKLNHLGLQGVLYNLDDLGVESYTENQEIDVERDGYFFKY